MFVKGDKVSVLDEDLSGVIVKINQDVCSVETLDGFLIDFFAHQLVKMNNSSELKVKAFDKASIHKVLSDKKSKKRTSVKVKAKERFEPKMEVDLHIHQLTKGYRSMSNHDMLTLQLETAKRQLNFAIAKRIQKVVFIHGVGAGVLKLELEYLFKRYDNIRFYDANYQKYGLGATEVYILQNV